MTDSIGHAAMQDAARREGSGAGINTVEIARKRRKEHASTGFSAAAMRALSARLLTFYFRAPVKAFFRPRIESPGTQQCFRDIGSYNQGFARAINPHVKAGEAWSWRMTSPFLLASAVKQYGWGFIPNHLLPPLIANTAVGAILYAAYLQSLGTMHEPSSRSTKRVYPPPPPTTSFSAGFVAGSIQSVFAAPLDALQTRFQSAEMLKGKYRDMSMWRYGWLKTREIGARGIFAGWSLSFLRDSLGAGVFFATFETIKSQAFYSFVSTWYGDWAKLSQKQKEDISIQMTTHGRPEIRPHYMVEPTFLALAGVSASITQALVQHPIQRIQEIHYGRLAWIDSHDRHQPGQRKVQALKLYATAYRKTIKQFLTVARREKGVFRWLYRDFFRSTATQVPSTAAGLIIFEIFRRKYGNDDEAVRIPKNGYEIVLI